MEGVCIDDDDDDGRSLTIMKMDFKSQGLDIYR